MLDSQVSNRAALEMRWLPVTDEQGRIRMQAVWIETAAAVPTALPATAHHAA